MSGNNPSEGVSWGGSPRTKRRADATLISRARGVLKPGAKLTALFIAPTSEIRAFMNALGPDARNSLRVSAEEET